MTDIPNIYPALPEILLAGAAMVYMMVGVFTRKRKALSIVHFLSLMSLVLVGFTILSLRGRSIEAFGGLFVSDDYAVFMKLLLLSGSFLTLVMSQSYLKPVQCLAFLLQCSMLTFYHFLEIGVGHHPEWTYRPPARVCP